jgi:DNA-binding protein HU-beta
MTKAELVEQMAKDAKISKAAAGKALNGAINAITKALKKGDSVTLVGFGTFSVSRRKARKGRNPQTGKEIKIPARKVAKFKAGAGLRDTVK